MIIILDEIISYHDVEKREHSYIFVGNRRAVWQQFKSMAQGHSHRHMKLICSTF